MSIVMQFIINGIMVGAIYSVIAVGIVLVYKASKIFNFAAGGFTMIGAFFMWTFYCVVQFPLFISIILAIISVGVTAFIMQRLAIQPLIGQSLLSILLVTLGLSHLLEGLVMFTWGGTSESLPEIFPGKTLFIGQLVIGKDLLWSFFVSIAVMIFLLLFFKFTHAGLAMRGVAEDHQVAQARGINVTRIFGATWFLAGTVASVGGILLSVKLGVSQFIGAVGFKAFPVVLIGGLESIGGAFIGGLIVGLLENLVGGLIAPWLMEVTPYILLLFVLFVRPEGLFGLKRIERI